VILLPFALVAPGCGMPRPLPFLSEMFCVCATQQNFAKCLPTARGSRPLNKLSQHQVYVLWRADLIRALEAQAKATSNDLDSQIAIRG